MAETFQESRDFTYVLHAATSAHSVQDRLGAPEYSYYFVLEGLLKAVEGIGSAVVVADPAEADGIFDACGGRCVLLSIAPPHQAPSGLRCPVIPVFAWEYSNIPNEQLDDDPRSDWRTVLARHGRAITLSNYAAATVRAEMGPAFPIGVVTVPVFEQFAELRQRQRGERPIALSGSIFDSRQFGPFFERPLPPVQPARLGPARRLRESARLTLHYGVLWYREAVRDMLLPTRVKRGVAIAGRSYSAVRRLARPRSASSVPSPVSPAKPSLPAPPRAVLPAETIGVSGVVFTSVFNPDGRKNMTDILTAFCYAFRDTPDATLVLKMVHHDRAAFEPLLQELTTKLAPFQCRIITLQGWMDDAAYHALVEATDIYVNASSAEGLCLPLMEFMSAGRPAIAPGHTAMADYITPDNAFVLRAGLEHNVWPHDPRDLFRTMRYRLEWDSLRDAFLDAYAVATADEARYGAMSAAAVGAMRRTCSLSVVQSQLAQFMALA